MKAEERAEFEANPYYRDAVRLRHWDDTAKVPGLAVPGLEHYRHRLEAAAGAEGGISSSHPVEPRVFDQSIDELSANCSLSRASAVRGSTRSSPWRRW